MVAVVRRLLLLRKCDFKFYPWLFYRAKDKIFNINMRLFILAAFLLPLQLISQIVVTVPRYSGRRDSTIERLYTFGKKSFESKSYNHAANYYKACVNLDSNFIDAIDNLGLTFRRLGKLDSAVYCYKLSIKKYPKGTAARLNLGVICQLQKKYTEALAYYKEVLRIDSNEPEGYYGNAHIYHYYLIDYSLSAKNYLEAAKKYKAKKSRYLSECYYHVGLSYHYLNKTKNAKRYLLLAKALEYKIDDKLVKLYQL